MKGKRGRQGKKKRVGKKTYGVKTEEENVIQVRWNDKESREREKIWKK